MPVMGSGHPYDTLAASRLDVLLFVIAVLIVGGVMFGTVVIDPSPPATRLETAHRIEALRTAIDLYLVDYGTLFEPIPGARELPAYVSRLRTPGSLTEPWLERCTDGNRILDYWKMPIRVQVTNEPRITPNRIITIRVVVRSCGGTPDPEYDDDIVYLWEDNKRSWRAARVNGIDEQGIWQVEEIR